MPVGVQHDGFIEAGPHCISLYESRIHIRARDFAACRDRVVIDAPPRRNRNMHVLFILVVRAERHDHDRDFGRQIVKANADHLVRVERQRADVEVFLMSFGPDQLHQTLQQIVAGTLQVHAQELRGLQETAEVVVGSENE